MEGISEEYFLKNVQVCQLPSPLSIQQIAKDVIIRSCLIYKCWGISNQASSVYISLSSGSLTLDNLIGEKCQSDYDIQFLNIDTPNRLLSVQFTNSRIYSCSENSQKTETHSSIIKGGLLIKDINVTNNKSGVDSLFGLHSNTEKSTIKLVVFKDCESITHTGIYSESKYIKITQSDFINNTLKMYQEYGLICQYQGNMDITNSNFISSATSYLFSQIGTGKTVVNGCFIVHPTTTTYGNCEVKNNAKIPFEIHISNPNLPNCQNDSANEHAGVWCVGVFFFALFYMFNKKTF